MKLCTSLLAAATLFASYASSIPLDTLLYVPHLSLRTGSTTDYNIAQPIADMFKNNHASLQGVCQTNGGWEVAAQVLLETEFRHSFDLGRKKYNSLREQPVYTDSSMAADFVLPATAEKTGMIIELKCENKNSNAGANMRAKVQSDINKASKIKEEYKDYQFVVVAMAYSAEAETALTTGLQMKEIPGALLSIEESVYDGSSGSSKAGSDTEMKDVSDTESNTGQSVKSQNSQGSSSGSSTKSLNVKAYQKEIDPQAPITTSTAPTRTSDRQKAQKAQQA